MTIRRATIDDMEGLNELLRQVLTVHHNGRPDLFKGNAKKYTDEELAEIIRDDSRPIFAATDDAAPGDAGLRGAGPTHVLGYAFCVFQQHPDDNILTPIRTLYIDDLCVEETLRGQGVGKALYEYVKAFAKESGCYNVTLNVWALNGPAKAFYEACGLVPQKYGMEAILK